MVVIVLTVAFGAGLLIIGVIQGQLATAIFGGLILVFLVWALDGDSRGGGEDNDDGEA